MKLSGWTWLITGICLSIAFFSYCFFYHIKPDGDEAVAMNAHADDLEAEGNKMNAAKERVKKAAQKVEEISAQWQMVVNEKTPPADLAAGGINLGVTPFQLTVDAVKFKNNVQRDVNYQVKRGGVKVLDGPEVASPTDSPTDILASYFNYPAASFPVAIFNLGTVTVEGSYSQIKANVQSWSSMPDYLAVTDGLSITGTGTKLTGTYNVVVVAFIRGDSLPPTLQAPGGGGGGSTTPNNTAPGNTNRVPSNPAPPAPGGNRPLQTSSSATPGG